MEIGYKVIREIRGIGYRVIRETKDKKPVTSYQILIINIQSSIINSK